MYELVDKLQKTPLEFQCSMCKKFANHTKIQAYFGGGMMCKPCLSKIGRHFNALKPAKVSDSWPN